MHIRRIPGLFTIPVMLMLSLPVPATGLDVDALMSRLERLCGSGPVVFTVPSGGFAEKPSVSAIVPLADGRLVVACDRASGYYGFTDDEPGLYVVDPVSGDDRDLHVDGGILLASSTPDRGILAAFSRQRIAVYSVSQPDPGLSAGYDPPVHVSSLAALSASTVATGGRDARIRLIGGGYGNEGEILIGHAGTVTGLVALGDTLFSSSVDGSIKAWDTASPKLLGTMRPGNVPVVSVGPGPDVGLLAAVLADGFVAVYDASSYSKIGIYGTGLGAVSSCAFAPDGKAAVLSDGKGTIVVFDFGSGREVFRAGGTDETSRNVTAFAVSDGGLVLYRGMSDGTVTADLILPMVLSMLSGAGVPEKTGYSRLAGLLFAGRDPVSASSYFEKASDIRGMTMCARKLLENGFPDSAADIFRKTGDAAGVADAGKACLALGEWEVAYRFLSETGNPKTAAGTVGDACAAASDFDSALKYYVLSGDPARLKKLAEAFFMRKEFAASSRASMKAGDREGMKKAAEALYASGGRLEAATILAEGGEKATAASWAGKLLEAGGCSEAGAIYKVLSDRTGMKKAAAVLQAKGSLDKAFELYLAAGDAQSARKIPELLVSRGHALLDNVTTMQELKNVSGNVDELFSEAERLYEEGGMLAEIPASLGVQMKKGDFMFSLYWYAEKKGDAKFAQAADAAAKAGDTITALFAYIYLKDHPKIVKISQTLMKAKNYLDAAYGFSFANNKDGMNSAAAALLSEGNREAAESLYRNTGNRAGLAALGDAAFKARDFEESSDLYGLAGDMKKFQTAATELEKQSGPGKTVSLYIRYGTDKIISDAAARFLSAGYLEEAEALFEKTGDKKALAAVAGKYLQAGLNDDAARVYDALGDAEGSAKARSRVSSGSAAARSAGVRTDETAGMKRKRADDAFEGERYLEAGTAYGELGDFVSLEKVIRRCIDEEEGWGGVSETAMTLSKNFSFRPGFLALAESAERNEQPLREAEFRLLSGDAEAVKRIAESFDGYRTFQDAETFLSLCLKTGDESLVLKTAEAYLSDGAVSESYGYAGPVESLAATASLLGSTLASKAAEKLLSAGSYLFPLYLFAGADDAAGLVLCAGKMLAEGEKEGAAAVYARIGDKAGLVSVARAYLADPDLLPMDIFSAEALYRLAGDMEGLSACGRLLLDRLEPEADYHEPALCFLQADDSRGLEAVAGRYAADGRFALASYWAGLSGNENLARSYASKTGHVSVPKISLSVKETDSEELASAIAISSRGPVWTFIIDPIRSGIPEGSADMMRDDLERAGFVVIERGTADYYVNVESYRSGMEEDDITGNRLEFQLKDSSGGVLLATSETGVPLGSHPVLENPGTIVSQRLGE